MKAGTTTSPTKDYVRVESARTDSAATWTTWVGPIRMESSDPQLMGMATDGLTDAAYQATYRTCMRRNGFLRRRARERGRGSSTSGLRRTVLGSAGMGGGRRLRGGVSRRHGRSDLTRKHPVTQAPRVCQN